MATFEDLLEYFDQQRGPAPKRHLGLPGNLADHHADLSHVRWGIVVSSEPHTPEELAHLEALKPLMAHREAEQKTRVLALNYKPGDTSTSFMARYELEPNQMVPEQIPYYLLLVGSPERIPWRFQVLLDSKYAVGRFWFDDPADATHYVKRLIAAEEQAASEKADLDSLFMAPRNPDDPATVSSHDSLVVRLLERLKLAPEPHALADRATRAQIVAWLKARKGVESKPGLFFGACHGREDGEIGSFLLQDPDSLSSADLPEELDLQGALFFIFACFSAGIPGATDLLPGEVAAVKLPPALTRLPQKLLAAGAGAYIGHVNRAWDYSFLGSARARPVVDIFYEVWTQLEKGVRVGHAMDQMSLSARDYLESLNELRSRASTLTLEEKRQFTEELWTWHDARYYVVLGDPAARLNLV